MKNMHRRTRAIGRAAMVALLVAPSLGAQENGRWENREQRDQDRDRNVDYRRRDEEREVLTWRGTVDDDTRIYLRAGRVDSRVISGSNVRMNERINRTRSLPRRQGQLRVTVQEGRGRVHVIQQPSAHNDYTAIVRVKDSPAGADRYRFVAYFDPIDDRRANGRDGRDGRVWDDIGGDVDFGDRVFNWRGQVDGDTRIVLRRGTVRYEVASGQQPSVISSSGANQLPRRDGQLGVSVRQGRGTFTVLQQPTAYNDYTTIIRVVDRMSGFALYDFDLIWQ
jgi:hypothetical protein